MEQPVSGPASILGHSLPVLCNSKSVKCVLRKGKWKESVFSYDILGLEARKGKCNEQEWLRMDVGQCFYSSASDGTHDFYRQTYPFITPMKSLCSMGLALLYLPFVCILTFLLPCSPFMHPQDLQDRTVCMYPWYPGNRRLGECSGV